MKFLTPLESRHIGGEWHELTKELILQDGVDIYSIPVGFITDFATTPKWLHFMFPPKGAWSAASVLHDYLYKTKIVSRLEADRLFFKAMLSTNVSLIIASTFYISVRLVGWVYY